MYLRTQTGSTWVDITGSNQNATYMGTLTTTTNFGGGYTTPANQTTRYILLPEGRLQSLPDGFNWTLSIWLEILSVSGTRHICSMADTTTDNAFIVLYTSSAMYISNSVLMGGRHLPYTLNTPMMWRQKALGWKRSWRARFTKRQSLPLLCQLITGFLAEL